MLTVILWLWQSETSPKYAPKHADRAARMIHANLTLPHRFLCITDTPEADFCPLIKPVKLWPDYRDLVSPMRMADKPQCYTRLKVFAPGIEALVGERIVSVDLDCVVTGNLDALFSGGEDFVTIRRPPIERYQVGVYQTSMFILRTGSRPQVWTDFHGADSLNALVGVENSRDYLLADQGWILYKLGPYEATWNMHDGVYDWRWLVQEHLDRDLPHNARIVFFPGEQKPWTLEDAPGWVKEAG